MEEEKKITDEVTEEPDATEEATAPETEESPAPEKTKSEKADKKLKAQLAKQKEELAALEAALAEEKDAHLRLAAEYENFRRRSATEKEGIYGDAVADAVGEILPLLDNLARAAQFTEADKVAEGLAMLSKMSDEMLARLGVTPFGAVGEKFDPNIHNAVMHAEDEAFGENEITDVFQTGYRRGDKIIRFAMVKVAN